MNVLINKDASPAVDVAGNKQNNQKRGLDRKQIFRSSLIIPLGRHAT
jgi:hypothetical protein